MIDELRKTLNQNKFSYRGYDAIKMENGRLDFKRTFLLKGITKSGNVKLGDIYSEGPTGITGVKNRIGKVRKIGNKDVLTLGSGRGTDNYYLDLW